MFTVIGPALIRVSLNGALAQSAVGWAIWRQSVWCGVDLGVLGGVVGWITVW